MTPPKTILAAALGVAICSLSVSANAQTPTCEGTPGPARLLIDISGMTSTRGEMSASLYPGDKSQFLIKNGALKVWYAPVTSPETHMCIWLKAPGTYALSIYHDANSNHKLDVSPFSNSERIGFSNNPKVFWAKPSYESAKFTAKAGDTTLHINLVTGK